MTVPARFTCVICVRRANELGSIFPLALYLDGERIGWFGRRGRKDFHCASGWHSLWVRHAFGASSRPLDVWMSEHEVAYFEFGEYYVRRVGAEVPPPPRPLA